MSPTINRILGILNLKTADGCYLCTGCGKPIPIGQEHWDEIDLPWHYRCIRPQQADGIRIPDII